MPLQSSAFRYRQGAGNGEKPGESGDKGNSPKARLTARKPDSDKKTSVEDLLIDEDPGSGNNPPGSSGTSNLNNSATVRTAMPPNVNPSIASSGDGDADGDKDNAPKDFDPYSDYEVFDSGKFSTEDIGNWAKNLPPIRGVNDKIEEKRNDYQNWLKETPKTPEERDKKSSSRREESARCRNGGARVTGDLPQGDGDGCV